MVIRTLDEYPPIIDLSITREHYKESIETMKNMVRIIEDSTDPEPLEARLSKLEFIVGQQARLLSFIYG